MTDSDDIIDKLDSIERLLALNLAHSKSENEAIALLYRAGYSSNEIGNFVGLSDSTVRSRYSRLRDEGLID